MSFPRYVKRSATFRRNARNRCLASTSNIYEHILALFKMQRNASSREIYINPEEDRLEPGSVYF